MLVFNELIYVRQSMQCALLNVNQPCDSLEEFHMSLLYSLLSHTHMIDNTNITSHNKQKTDKYLSFFLPLLACLPIHRNAKACGAMKHCIQAVWEKHTYPVDNDSICKICKDMVGQARDQLRSNETQADLKAVFEGTCDLIRVKMVRTECDKLADDFVPELVEALSSQMNPDVVCSVAGLCNNAAIDAQLAQIEASQSTQVAAKANLFSCKQCGQVSSVISNKFQQTDRDQVLDNMLGVCGRFGSFSDGCSNIVLSYFNEIYDHLKGNLNKDSLCHMSGACSEMYHQHEEQVGDDQETSEEDSSEEINFDLALQKGDDIPCDLCKQLIVHLR